MNIFEKRPLSLILCIGLGGFFLFTFENIILRISLAAIAVLPLIFSFISTFEKRTLMLMRISGIVLLLSFLLSFLYFDLYFKLYNRYEKRVEIVGVVEEIAPSSTAYTQRLTVEIESINGKDARGYKVYAYPTKTDSKGIIENTRISFTTTLGGFSKDTRQFNISKGINAYANEVEDIKILEHTKGDLTSRLNRAREYLARYMILISDSDTGALLSALLLGERDYLPDQLRLDFKRIGISHILALSGMHLAILSLGIGTFLSYCKVKKKTRVITTSIFILIYMALTGFSVSVCRAGIMLLISSLLFLLGWGKDSFTSLSVAVTIICLFTPHAIYDISLWLSAGATFGIIAFGEYNQRKEKPSKPLNKVVQYIHLSVMASLFAISSTLLISTLSFGGFSILSIIATLIFSLLSEVIMYLGCIMALIGWLIPIGFIIAPFAKLLYFIASIFSSFKFAFVSSDFLIVKISIILYSALFFVFIIAKIKNREKWMKIIIVSFAAVMILPVFGTVAYNLRETVSYSAGHKSDIMLVRSKNQVCLINSSQYSKSTAYDAINLLEDAKVTTVDKYYLTHYSWSLDEDIETLLYNISVDQIYIPTPRNDDEKLILKILHNSVKQSHAEIVTFDMGELVEIGEYNLSLLYSSPYGQTSMNAFLISNDDVVYTYISSGLLQGKTGQDFEEIIWSTDYLILGDHGKKYKERIYLTECYDDLDALVIHSDNIFLKQNNMKYLQEKGCDIYSHPEQIIYFVK